MTKPIARDPMYRKRVFDPDIIELCVRWYITYRLSYRDLVDTLVEMMAERGIEVAHTTVLRWVTRYVPEFGVGLICVPRVPVEARRFCRAKRPALPLPPAQIRLEVPPLGLPTRVELGIDRSSCL